MSTILVADDNSNIQKMVGLALKDQGIEVVAVGNGEAAVRRIPDIHPDLVLADVFMPVKNGYEVCEFVKKDQRFSHIPVILLVGAFDPLDEHEAQRVGADGVLKKPFVPPDPLISMVKSALSRSSGESGRPRPIPMPKRAAVQPADARIPSVDASPAPPAAVAAAESEAGEVAPEVPHDDLGIPPRPESVSFNGGAPLAFGSLLETGSGAATHPEPEPPAEEYIAPIQHPALVEARSWGATPAEEEVEEEEEPRASWRRDESEEQGEIAASDSIGSVKDWRDFEEPAKSAPAHTDVQPVEEEPKGSASNFFAPLPPSESDGVVDDHSGGGNSQAAEAESFFASHAETEQEEIHEPSAPEERAEAPEVTPEQAKNYETVFTPESYPGLFVEERRPTKRSLQDDSADAPSAFAEVTIREEEQAGAAADAKKKRGSVTSEGEVATPNLWEEQVREAARSVAESWPSQNPAAEFTAPSAERADPSLAGSAPDETAAESHEEQAWEEEHTAAAEVYAPRQVSPEPPVYAPAREPASQIPGGALPATAAPPGTTDIEAVVAKVLERLDPSIFQSVTQQLLKPVVEAIVRSELEKKR